MWHLLQVCPSQEELSLLQLSFFSLKELFLTWVEGPRTEGVTAVQIMKPSEEIYICDFCLLIHLI